MKITALFTTLFFLVPIFVINTGCRKNIAVPDDATKQLFGAWQWVRTDGGINGGFNTPAIAGYDKYIEYTEKGNYTKYQRGNKTESLRFTISQETSVVSGHLASIISYRKGGLLNHRNQNDFIRHSIEFKLDSLILHEETTDGLKYYYVKK